MLYIEMKKSVKVPNGFYCDGCSAFKLNDNTFYCEVTGEILAQDKTERCIKTNTCFAEIRNHLRK